MVEKLPDAVRTWWPVWVTLGTIIATVAAAYTASTVQIAALGAGQTRVEVALAETKVALSDAKAAATRAEMQVTMAVKGLERMESRWQDLDTRQRNSEQRLQYYDGIWKGRDIAPRGNNP